MADVEAAAQRSEAVIYWLRLEKSAGANDAARDEGALYSVWRGPAEHAEELRLLERTVEGSGGRVVPVGDLAQVGPAFASVLEELREHYVLGYYPPAGAGRGTHKVTVEVTGDGGLRVRTRGRRLD
jgi:hypothetical protein